MLGIAVGFLDGLAVFSADRLGSWGPSFRSINCPLRSIIREWQLVEVPDNPYLPSGHFFCCPVIKIQTQERSWQGRNDADS